MKIRSSLLLIAGMSLAFPLAATAQHIQFELSWHGTRHFNDVNGNLISKGYSEKDIIQAVAADNGVDPKGLVLVYRMDAADMAVVDKATGGGITQADVLQFPDVSRLDSNWITKATKTNTSGNPGQIVEQAFIFDESHDSPLGSIYGTENPKYDSIGNVTGDSFHGTFQFGYDGNGPIFPAGVYSGSFSTGKRIADNSGG